jgi:hypothetical protein
MIASNQAYIDQRNEFDEDVIKSLTNRASRSKRYKGKTIDMRAKIQELRVRRKALSKD